MPTIVMKESPESDYYIGWSSVVEAPVFGADREWTLAHLMSETDPYLREDAPHHPARRLERVDATGTSAMWVHAAGMTDRPEEGAWDDDGHIYMQRGVVSRANMFVLTRRILADESADVTDLLSPFEDEDEVRPA